MPDLSSGPMEFEIGTERVRFARIRPYMLMQALDWLNEQVVSRALAAMSDASPADRADMVRRVARTYTSDSISELANDSDYLMHVLYLSYVRENPGKSKSDFISLFDFADVRQIEILVDVLSGFSEQGAPAADSDDGRPNPPESAGSD